MPRRSYPVRDRVPPGNDPRWLEWTASLLVFIQTAPTSRANLADWRRRKRYSRAWMEQLLSWLANERLIELDADAMWCGTADRDTVAAHGE